MGCPELAKEASFWIEGFLVATVVWQDIHVLAGGKVINLPGSGLVWQEAHSRPNARCVLWLYGTG
jgi:hypothetical protein